MKIGFCYDLKDDYLAAGYSKEDTTEFDSAVTIDGIEAVLLGLGHQVDRIGHIRALTRRLAAGDRWDLVFNIAEGIWGIGREAQVPALLEAWNIPYVFSDPGVMCLALDKGACKRVVQHAGLPTAPFAVIREMRDLQNVNLPFPLFAKPIGEGTSKGIGADARVANVRELETLVGDLLRRYRQPVLVETYLPGREITVGIVGTGATARVIGVMEVVPHGPTEDFWYSAENKEHYEHLVSYRAPTDEEAQWAANTALAAWRLLGARDGGRVDMRSDANGQPCFMEINPLAGLNPTLSDLVFVARFAGIEYPTLIRMILEAAQERLGLGSTVHPQRPLAA